MITTVPPWRSRHRLLRQLVGPRAGRRAAAVIAIVTWLGPAGDGPRAEKPLGPAPASAPYFVKTAASLAEVEKTLQGKGGHSTNLLAPAATGIEIVWRHEEDHESKDLEVHDAKDHVFFVTDGDATFTLGGALLQPREVAPGEWRAPRAEKAEVVETKKGDLLFLPHGTVHGRSVKGRRFTMLQLSFFPAGAPRPSPKPGASPATSTPPQEPSVTPAKSWEGSAPSRSGEAAPPLPAAAKPR